MDYLTNREFELSNRILELLVRESGHDLYDKALEHLLEALDSEYGAFGYIDERGDLVCPTMSKVFDMCEMNDKCVLYKQHQWTGLWGRALREQCSFVANQVPPVPAGHVPIDNNLAVPIAFQGESIGLFNVANKPGGYTEEDRLLLDSVAERIAPVLYAWTQRELRDAERAHAAENLKRVIDLTVEERNRLEAVLGSLQEAVLIFDSQGDLIDANEAAVSLHGYSNKETMVCHYGDAMIEKSALDGAPLTADKRPIARIRRGEVFRDQELEVHVPETGARFIGSYGGSPVLDGDGRATASVVTIHDVTELRERMRLGEALDEIGLVIQSSLELDDILPSVVVMAAAALGADSAGVTLREDGHWLVPYATGVPERHIGGRFSDKDFPLAVEAEKTRQLAYWRQQSDYPEMAGAEPHGANGNVNAPLFVGETFLGTIAFHHDEPYRFQEHELDFVRRLAANISLALHNAKLYQGERRVAHTLQEALLRVPDSIDGVDFGARYESATEVALVGGDFYDIFRIGGTHVGILMGDIAGKGLDAAVLTSLVKNTVRAFCSSPSNPSDVLARTNEILFVNTEPETFVTVFLALLDLRDGHLVYCNAGHTVGLLVRSGGHVAQLAPNCPLVGAFREAEFHSSETHLGLCDRLVLYTDGITEARAESGMFGEERLVGLVTQCGEQSPQYCADYVLAEVAAFAGGRLQDDAALMALRRIELPDGASGCQEMLF